MDKKLSNSFVVKAYASAVKSGCRFVDELLEVVIEQKSQGGMVTYLIDQGENARDEHDMTASLRKKEKAVKASFKIELTDEERKMRDSTQTTQYFTANG